MLVMLLPSPLIVILLLLFMSQMQGGGSRVLNFGKSKAKLITKDMPKTTFADVAGADEAVEELHEIKDFLQIPAKYQALGAKIPKGVLLFGPPGTGKTLLARAVAGEAGVPFYSISGSDFVEMFVGVGASRVRDLFEQAKAERAGDRVRRRDRRGRSAPGRRHGRRPRRAGADAQPAAGRDGRLRHQGRRDPDRGHQPARTSSTRPCCGPGRFDRQIPVDAPDMEGRKAILRVHAKGKPFAPDVDLDAVARRTPGFSGADLANVINEAALLTARNDKRAITNDFLEESDRPGDRRPRATTRAMSDNEKKITAYHEARARAGRLGDAAAGAGAQGDDPAARPFARAHAGAADRGQVHPDPGRDDRHPGVRPGWSGGGGAGLPRADHRRRQRHREGHRAGAGDGHPVRHERQARARSSTAPTRRRAVPGPHHGPRARTTPTRSPPRSTPRSGR